MASARCPATNPWSSSTCAVFDNLAGATVLDQSSQGSFGVSSNGYTSALPNEFINAGPYIRSGTGAIFIQAPFLNTGSVAVQAGDLQLTGPGPRPMPMTCRAQEV